MFWLHSSRFILYLKFTKIWFAFCLRTYVTIVFSRFFSHRPVCSVFMDIIFFRPRVFVVYFEFGKALAAYLESGLHFYRSPSSIAFGRFNFTVEATFSMNVPEGVKHFASSETFGISCTKTFEISCRDARYLHFVRICLLVLCAHGCVKESCCWVSAFEI